MFRALAWALLLCLSASFPAWGWGESAARPPAIQAWPSTQEEWLAGMLEAGRNGLALKNPETFLAWLDALSEPRYATALATVVLQPGGFPRGLAGMVDPSTVRNWAELSDPNQYMRWMLAGLESRFYTALYNRPVLPEKLLRMAGHAARPGCRALGALGATLVSSPGSMSDLDDRFGKAASVGRDEGWLRLPDATVRRLVPARRY